MEIGGASVYRSGIRNRASGFVHVAGAHTGRTPECGGGEPIGPVSGAADFDGDGAVDAAVDHRGDLRGSDLSRLFATAVGRADAKRVGGNRAFGGGVWRRASLPRSAPSGSNCGVRRFVWMVRGVAEDGSAGEVCTRAAGRDCAIVDEVGEAVTDETPRIQSQSNPKTRPQTTRTGHPRRLRRPILPSGAIGGMYVR